MKTRFTIWQLGIANLILAAVERKCKKLTCRNIGCVVSLYSLKWSLIKDKSFDFCSNIEHISVLSHCFWVRGTRPSYFTSHETDTAGPLCPRWVEKDSAVQKEIIGLLQNRLPLQLYTYCVISCFRIWHKPNRFCIKGSDTCAQDHCWNLLSWMSTEYLPEELIVLKHHSIHTSFTHKTLTRVNSAKTFL